MKSIALILCVIFCSCEYKNEPDLAGGFRCTKDQLDIVKAETKICSDSGFFSTKCFIQAKKSHCDKIDAGVK